MRRSFLKPVLALVASTLVAGVLPSCATNDSLLFVSGVALRKAGACSVQPDLESAMLAQGALDRILAKEYVATLIVGNQITQRGSRDRLRTETSRIAIKGAEVKLESPRGTELVPPFSSIGTGFVDASDGTEAAVSTISATLIPASIALTLPPGIVVAKVRVFGNTLGGEEVESSELSFPIEVCDGCLIAYPASARDPAFPGDNIEDYRCKEVVTDQVATSEDVDQPCQLGVDFPISCLVCSTIYAECKGPSQNPYYL